MLSSLPVHYVTSEQEHLILPTTCCTYNCLVILTCSLCYLCTRTPDVTNTLLYLHLSCHPYLSTMLPQNMNTWCHQHLALPTSVLSSLSLHYVTSAQEHLMSPTPCTTYICVVILTCPLCYLRTRTPDIANNLLYLQLCCHPYLFTGVSGVSGRGSTSDGGTRGAPWSSSSALVPT